MRVRFVVHDAIMQNIYNLLSCIVLSNYFGGSSHFRFLVFILQIHYEYGIIKQEGWGAIQKNFILWVYSLVKMILWDFIFILDINSWIVLSLCYFLGRIEYFY